MTFSIFRFWRVLFLSVFWNEQPVRAQSGCAGIVDPTFASPGFQAVPLLASASNGVVAALGHAVVRLDATGALDSNFGVAVWKNHARGNVYGIARDSVGRYLIWGDFDMANFSRRPGIARILANGQLDSEFEPPAVPLNVYLAALQGNQGIIVGIRTNVGGVERSTLVRLKVDGSVDPGFSIGAGPNLEIRSLAVQADGKILVGGRFDSFDGQPRKQLCRLLANGALEENFKPQRLVPEITGLKALPDGRFLTYWSGGFYNGGGPDDPATNSLVRYHEDGSVDADFTPLLSAMADVELQDDGKYLAIGHEISRLLSNGQRDPGFSNEFTSFSSHFSPTSGSLAIGWNNEIFAGLPFWGPGNIVRLLNDQDTCVPLISFERDHYIFNEADGVVSIPVVRTANLNDRTTFSVSASGFTTNMVFNTGEDRVLFQLPLESDQALEPSQPMNLGLSNLSPGAGFGAHRWSEIVVTDATSANAPGSVKTNVLFKIEGGPVSHITVCPDGKILVAGSFTEINGVPGRNMARLNPDLSVDSSFQYSLDDYVYRVAVSGENIYVSHLVHLNASVPLRRLNADGSPDETFPPPNFLSPYAANLQSLAVQPDGKLLVAGHFTNVNGITRVQLARFNIDGSVDTTFDAGLPLSEIAGIATLGVLTDGSILAGGHFPVLNGKPLNSLMHLSASGALLDDFQLPAPSFPLFEVTGIIPEPGGGALVTGGERVFTAGSDRHYVIRFNSAGELDPSFNPTPWALTGAALATKQSDGKIVLVGGEFQTQKMIRLLADGTLDPSFYVPEISFVYSLAALANGDILAGGGFSRFNLLRTESLALLRGGTYEGPGVFELERSVSAPENGGTMKVRIRRLWSTTGPATVRFKTREAAYFPLTNGVNYLPVDISVPFADGQAEAEASIPLIDTPEIEFIVHFEATLEAESPGTAVNPERALAFLTITDDQTAIVLRPHEGPVTEGLLSALRFSVEYRGPVIGPASVEVVTGGGTAVAGVDYEPISQIVYLDETNTYRELNVSLLDDNVFDPNKTFTISLRNPQGAALGNPSSFEVTIKDNPASLTLTPREIVAIQNDGFIKIQASRTDFQANGLFRLRYETEGGTARPGIEYIPQQGEITFFPGQRYPEDITIPLLPNRIVGPPTTIQLKLTVIEGEAVVPDPIATITLKHPPAVTAAGTLDSSFKPLQQGGNSFIYQVARTLEFVYVVGLVPDAVDSSSQLHRYRHDGTYDTTYEPDVLGVPKIFPLPDGKILASTPSEGLRRLRTDGSVDRSFQSKLPGLLDIVAIEPAEGGKIIVAGGILIHSTFFSYVTQLLSNGDLDPNFRPVTFDESYSYLTSLVRQPDGRILIGGPFKGINGVPRPDFARLLPDGELDSSFNPSAHVVLTIYQIQQQPDGKIVAAGAFWKTPDDPESVLRFHEDGSLDIAWSLPFTENDDKHLIGLDHQGRAYFNVTHVISGTDRWSEVLRTLADGSVDQVFHVAPGAGGLQITPEGLLVLGPSSGDGVLLSRRYLDPPIMIDQPELLSNGRVGLYFNVPVMGPYVLERTQDFVNWVTVTNGVSDTGYVRLETDSFTSGARFYRLHTP
jgi:uncharacterized delta-60 repeat protein